MFWSHAKFGATFPFTHVEKFLETLFQLKVKLICHHHYCHRHRHRQCRRRCRRQHHHHHHPFFLLVVMQCKDFQHKTAYLLVYCGYVLMTFQIIHPNNGTLIHQLLNPGKKKKPKQHVHGNIINLFKNSAYIVRDEVHNEVFTGINVMHIHVYISDSSKLKFQCDKIYIAH